VVLLALRNTHFGTYLGHASGSTHLARSAASDRKIANVGRRSAFLLDGVVAIAWAVLVASFSDINTTLDWAVVVGSAVLAGTISGRYRILLLATIVLVPVAVILNPGGSCDASSGCEDDLALGFKILFLGVLIGAFALMMAFGVFLRRSARWRRSQGPWALSGGSD
jgi:hypothetical protein